MARNKARAIADLIYWLEVKIRADAATSGVLDELQQQLDAMDVLHDERAGKQYQYALELQALIYGVQNKDREAERYIGEGIGQAGSPKKLYSIVLKDYIRTHTVKVVPPLKSKVISSAADMSMLGERDQKFLLRHGLEGAPDTEFFVRETRMLILLSVCTFNFYQCYWFYKNWKVVRGVSNEKISPFWRTFFSIFYVWPMFRIMILQARLRGYKTHYSGGLLALGYLLPGFIAFLVPHSLQKFQLVFTSIVVSLIAVSMLLLAQQAAVFNNEHLRNKTISYSQRGKYEVAFIVVATALMIFNLSLTFRAPDSQFSGSVIEQFKTSIKITNAKISADTLTSEYKRCAAYIDSHKANVNPNDQTKVVAFKQYSDKCEAIHQEQIQAVNAYDKLVDNK